MEIKDIKDGMDAIKSAFEQFKQANDERISAIEKGAPDPLIEEKVAKLDEAMDAKQAALDERIKSIETLSARRISTGAGGENLDEKALKWAIMNAKARGIAQPEQFTDGDMKSYRDAFTAYMRKGTHAEELHSKALSVGVDPDGGYVVEPDTSGRIVQKIFETSPMRQVAAVQTIGTDALEGLFDLDEASANWVGETGARPATDTPDLARWRIPVHELYAFPQATQKVLDDAMINLEAWLGGKVADKFARTENAAFVNGNGVGKPRGFLTYADGTTLPGTIQQFDTGVNGAFASSPNGGDILLDAIYGMKQQYRSGASWHMNRSVVGVVRKLKNSDGDYLWAPGIAVGQTANLLGFPILEFDDMPDLATGSLSVAFANMSEGYQIVDRQGIRVLRDPYSNKPYVGFYSVKRTGGDVVNFEAIKLVAFKA